MGWTGIHATEYKNGRINRKAQMDSEMNDGVYEVLKSTMVGSTYYAAVKHPHGYVFGLVGITTINTRDWFDFTYKLVSEDMGPVQSECPASILALLSPTDNEYALAWRERCKKIPVGRLPVGTVIQFACPFETRSGHKVGDIITLTKTVRNRFSNARGSRTTTMWSDGFYRWAKSMIPSDYQIVEV